MPLSKIFAFGPREGGGVPPFRAHRAPKRVPNRDARQEICLSFSSSVAFLFKLNGSIVRQEGIIFCKSEWRRLSALIVFRNRNDLKRGGTSRKIAVQRSDRADNFLIFSYLALPRVDPGPKQKFRRFSAVFCRFVRKFAQKLRFSGGFRYAVAAILRSAAARAEAASWMAHPANSRLGACAGSASPNSPRVVLKTV